MRITAEQATMSCFAEQEDIVLVQRSGVFSFTLYGHRSMERRTKLGLLVEIESPTDEAEIQRMVNMVAKAKGERNYPPIAQEQDIQRYRTKFAL